MPWLGPVLNARDASGRPLYTLEQAEDFICALLLSQGVEDLGQLPGPLSDLLARFSARAELPPEAGRAESEAAVAAYFGAHPIPERLKRDFGAHYRAMLTELDHDALAQAALHLTGEAPIAKTKAAPAEGPKGALAYFAARKKTR